MEVFQLACFVGLGAAAGLRAGSRRKTALPAPRTSETSRLRCGEERPEFRFQSRGVKGREHHSGAARKGALDGFRHFG